MAGQRQATGDEERFQQSGRVSRAATGAAAVGDGVDQRGGRLAAGAERELQAAQMAQADRGRRALEQPVGERAESLGAALALEMTDALRLGMAAGALNATRRGLGTGKREEIELLAGHVTLRPSQATAMEPDRGE